MWDLPAWPNEARKSWSHSNILACMTVASSPNACYLKANILLLLIDKSQRCLPLDRCKNSALGGKFKLRFQLNTALFCRQVFFFGGGEGEGKTQLLIYNLSLIKWRAQDLSVNYPCLNTKAHLCG